MHEMSIATAVVNTACKHAGNRPVTTVSVRVGRLRQVVPESLSFYFEIVARDSVCEHARLELIEIEPRLSCRDCGHAWAPLPLAFRCPDCASTDVLALSGEELEVEYIEVEEPDAVAEEAECTAPK